MPAYTEGHPIDKFNCDFMTFHSFKYIVVLILVFLAASCGKNEFTIEFELPAQVNSTYKLAYYASDSRGGTEVETAVAMAGGKAKMLCVTRNPSAVWIFSPRQSLPSLIIFAGRGDKINVSGESDNPMDWNVKGGAKENKLLADWRVENKEILRKALEALGRENSGAPQKALNASVAKFVKDHSDSPASILLMNAYYDPALNPKEFSKLMAMLDESGVAEKFPALMARHDLVAFLQGRKGDSSLSDIVTQGYQTNLDTIRLKSSAVPTLLYIWTPEDVNREASVDTLKRLVGWRGDSASMAIADICLTNDSSSWSYTIKRDSLRHTLRAFALRGFADPQLMRIGIRKSPWYIVTSGNGKKIYSGPELTEAAGHFRKLKTPSHK